MKSKAFELENIFKMILRDLPVNIYWKDSEGRYLGCNDAMMRVSKYLVSPDVEIMGKTDLELWEAVAKEVMENDKKIMEEKKECVFEEIGVDEFGNKVHYLSMKRPIFDENNNAVGILGVSINNNTQKELEKVKQEAEIIQEKLNAITVAIGMLAHELRTPLASIQQAMYGIKKYFNVLLDSYNLAVLHHLPVQPIRSSKQVNLESASDRILREIFYANNFINLTLNNLRVMRADALTLEDIDIANVIQKTIENYPFDEDEQSLVEFDPSHNFIVFGNETYLINIFINLIKNALYYIKVAQKGSVKIWLEIGSDYNKVFFKDTGQGIPPEIIDHLFKEFYTTSEHGIGLGLTFCKAAMESMLSQIEVESVYGKYTLMTLTFPSSRRND